MSTTTTTTPTGFTITPAEITSVFSLVKIFAGNMLAGVGTSVTTEINLLDTEAKAEVAALQAEIDSGTASTLMQDIIAGVQGFLSVAGLPAQSETAIVAAIDAVIDDVAKVAESV